MVPAAVGATWVVVATPAVVARAGAVEDKPAVEPPPEEGCAAASASTPSGLMDGGLSGALVCDASSGVLAIAPHQT